MKSPDDFHRRHKRRVTFTWAEACFSMRVQHEHRRHSFKRSLSTRYRVRFARCGLISDRTTRDSRRMSETECTKGHGEREGNRTGLYCVSFVTPHSRDSLRARYGWVWITSRTLIRCETTLVFTATRIFHGITRNSRSSLFSRIPAIFARYLLIFIIYI